MMKVRLYMLSDQVYPTSINQAKLWADDYQRSWGNETPITFAANLNSLRESRQFKENRCRCLTASELKELIDTGMVKSLAIRI